MKIYIGIDPGKEGAIARMECEAGKVAHVKLYDTPTMKAGAGGKRDYDEAAMAEVVIDLVWGARDDGCEVFIALEKQYAMPRIGVEPCPKCKRTPGPGITSTFETGKGYGIWIGIVAATMAPFVVVHPATWKGLLMRDAPKGKDASRMVATRMFPDAAGQLKRKKDHNRADAMLICEYGRRISSR